MYLTMLVVLFAVTLLLPQVRERPGGADVCEHPARRSSRSYR